LGPAADQHQRRAGSAGNDVQPDAVDVQVPAGELVGEAGGKARHGGGGAKIRGAGRGQAARGYRGGGHNSGSPFLTGDVRAVASPMPLLAPVTIAVVPVITGTSAVASFGTAQAPAARSARRRRPPPPGLGLRAGRRAPVAVCGSIAFTLVMRSSS